MNLFQARIALLSNSGIAIVDFVPRFQTLAHSWVLPKGLGAAAACLQSTGTCNFTLTEMGLWPFHFFFVYLKFGISREDESCLR